jgi:predicted nucleotidyltransferase component of viral defense system
MIPRADILDWRAHAPWVLDEQVEQDLLISRAVVQIFAQPVLGASLAFRGGTALHKLFLTPPSRYSDDIDLVQVQAGPIGPTLDTLRSVLDPLLGDPAYERRARGVTLRYTFHSEIPPILRMKLKLEINTREHFSVYGWHPRPCEVSSRWFSGKALVLAYSLEELLGTKLRALYQRRKGRDLFDLWLGLTRGRANPEMIVDAFRVYAEHDGLQITRDEFRENLLAKMGQRNFHGDIASLLGQGIVYDPFEAHALVDRALVGRL